MEIRAAKSARPFFGRRPHFSRRLFYSRRLIFSRRLQLHLPTRRKMPTPRPGKIPIRNPNPRDLKLKYFFAEPFNSQFARLIYSRRLSYSRRLIYSRRLSYSRRLTCLKLWLVYDNCHLVMGNISISLEALIVYTL
jgi:hypothetical protein